MPEFQYQKWTVSQRLKAPLLAFLVDGLEESGCTVLYTSSPAHAPFLITYETREGHREGILAYAFLANSKETTNRPPDEHRFQVKYGSNPQALLPIEQDPSHLLTTIFVGIDAAHGFLVGADPVLHDGTRQFISIEFKRRHAQEVMASGWAAWERDTQRDDSPIEVLVGVKRNRLLDFICFERIAAGVDQGHRQLLAEHILGSAKGNSVSSLTTHALLDELHLPQNELLDLIQGAKRLKMAVRGWVAEVHLERILQEVPGVQDCHRLEEEGSPDISLRYKGSSPILIECKNALRNTASDGAVRIDFQRTRAAKGDPCSRYYRPHDFSVLAACLHAVTESWEYRFVLTRCLPHHSKCPGRIASNLKVSGDYWTHDPSVVLRELSRQ